MSKGIYSKKLVFSRRSLLKGMFFSALLAPFCSIKVFGAEKKAKRQIVAKPLVVYLSQSENTRKLAEEIHKKVGGDILEIKTSAKFEEDYDTQAEYAKKGQKKGKLPEPALQKTDLRKYGVVFLGFDSREGELPKPIRAFAQKNRLDGKTVAPFITHDGADAQNTEADLKKLLPHSQVLKALSLGGAAHSSFEKEVIKWLEGLGPALIMTTTGNPAVYPDGGY